MTGDLYLSNAVIFNVPQTFSIRKGEKFVIKMDSSVGAKNWSANFDKVLTIEEGDTQASFEAKEVGVSNVVIMDQNGQSVVKRFDITVLENTRDLASTLGIEFSTSEKKKS